ncbi:hypothetical protein [Oceanisphaera arctica]|uniref:Uncharacterized protein n=1 Tax=Oceanisphaera arctica TaxID=641510 RepID=A0A2P5TK32_9GAMM|nr:hypothetical protein [Oceanisphaera arctica]PPL15469.1 hypothetical protein UN63_12385 [Oceanisphaera arctica]GHA05425.1 hypothetical protein GCM10007082_02920 [Oceanisphaera arctica]
MNQREMFYGFYRAARLNESGFPVHLMDSTPDAQEQKYQIDRAALLAGFDDFTIMHAEWAADMALADRRRQHAEPSRHSVVIQMLMFTHGRVRRSF